MRRKISPALPGALFVALLLALIVGVLLAGVPAALDAPRAQAKTDDAHTQALPDAIANQQDASEEALEAAKAYVDTAIARFAADPGGATAYYQSTDSIDDEFGLYLLLLRDGAVVVNPTFPSGYLGSDYSGATDALETPYGKIISEADEDGVVVEHLRAVREDNFTFRKKTAWAKRAGGLVFSAGWTDMKTDVESTLTPRQKAIGTAIKARARMLRLGRDAAIAYYNTPESIDGEYYVTIAQPLGTIGADAVMPELLSTNLRDLQASDDPELGQKIFALENGGELWITHLWRNPATGQEERRHTYALRWLGFYIVSGYYEDAPPALDPLERTKAYVNESIRKYDEDPEAAIEYYRSRDSVTDDELRLYLLLLKDGVILVNPVFPGAQNTGIAWRTDPLGREYGKALAEADEEGEVVEYLLPISSDNYTYRKKTAWAIRHKGLVFSAGWIDRETDVESTLTPRQKAIGTVIEVRARLQQEQGFRKAIDHYRTPESIEGEYYAIIADRRGNILADATRPDLPAGTNVRSMAASDDPALGQKIAAVESNYGEWIGPHLWRNPATGQEERRHTHVARFLGFYIISGYYEPEPCVQKIYGDGGTYRGTWGDDDCVSETRPNDPDDDGGSAGRKYYARFYEVTLDEASNVTVTLASDVDTFLYLLDGHGKSGDRIDKNDDANDDTQDSRIEKKLDAGKYTIEATTYQPNMTGDFTIDIDIDALPPPPKYKAISSGARHACAIRMDGAIDCRGDDSFGQVSERPKSGSYIQITSGDDHSCALSDENHWICWGNID